MNFGLAKSQTLNTYTFEVVQLRHRLIGHMKENWIQEQLVIIFLAMLNVVGAISFTIPLEDSKPGDTPIAKGDKFNLKQCPNIDLERTEMQKILYHYCKYDILSRLNSSFNVSFEPS